MVQIFLCHASEDKTQVREVYQHGLPGAASRKCTVRALAKNITFWPGKTRTRNSCKINLFVSAFLKGFLARAITTMKVELYNPKK